MASRDLSADLCSACASAGKHLETLGPAHATSCCRSAGLGWVASVSCMNDRGLTVWEPKYVQLSCTLRWKPHRHDQI